MAIDLDTVLTLPRQRKLLILVGTLALIVAIFVYLLYLPQYRKYTSLEEQIGKFRADLEAQKKISANLPKFKREAAVLEQQFELALKELPDTKEIPSLLTNISQLGRESGLQITLFQPQKEVPMDFYEEIPVKIKLYGSYRDMASFFEKVANLSRIVNIRDLSMSDATMEGEKVNLKVACTAVTFRFIEKGPETAQAKKEKKEKKKKP